MRLMNATRTMILIVLLLQVRLKQSVCSTTAGPTHEGVCSSLATLQVDLGPVVTGRDEDPTESQSRRLLLLPRAKGGPRAVRLSEHAIVLLNKRAKGSFSTSP